MKTTEQKVLSVLSYIGILFIIPLIASKDSYVRYHVNQGIVYFIVGIIAGIVSGVLAFIPYVGAIISAIISIALFVLFIIGIVNAAKGEEKPLPVIGNLFTIIK